MFGASYFRALYLRAKYFVGSGGPPEPPSDYYQVTLRYSVADALLPYDTSNPVLQYSRANVVLRYHREES